MNSNCLPCSVLMQLREELFLITEWHRVTPANKLIRNSEKLIFFSLISDLNRDSATNSWTMRFWFIALTLVIIHQSYGFTIDDRDSYKLSSNDYTAHSKVNALNQRMHESTTIQPTASQTMILVAPSCRKGYMIIGGTCRKNEKLLAAWQYRRTNKQWSYDNE